MSHYQPRPLLMTSLFLVIYIALCSLTMAGETAPAVVAKPFRVERLISDFDRADLLNPGVKRKQKKLIHDNPGWLEYDLVIPATGWYSLLLGPFANLRYEVFVDGTELSSWAGRGEDAGEKRCRLQANTFLQKGSHTIRVQRMGWPYSFPQKLILLAAQNLPARVLQGKLVSPEVLRVGDKLTFTIQGGSTKPLRYQFMTRKAGASDWVKAGEVSFPATTLPILRQVSLPCLEEGTFALRLWHNGISLPPAILQMDSFAVIDTRPSIAPTGTLQKKLVCDIDCVKQTRNGKPLRQGVDFWEANGASRVITSPAGTYRESAPSQVVPNSADVGKKTWGIISGIAYAIDVAQEQALYLLEVEYPDDDRRTVSVGVVENVVNKTPTLHLTSNSSAGYETGGWYPLTQKKQTLRIFFYGRQRELRVQLMSFGGGLRAAVSKIRVYRIIGGLPAGPPNRPDGRMLANYFEEMIRWRQYFSSSLLQANGYEKDFVGLTRWIQFSRYLGYNCIWPTENIYGRLSYRSKVYNFFYDEYYTAPRVAVLLCEKYGMKYVPELQVRPPHPWFETRVMEKLTPDPDMYCYHWSGLKGSGDSYHVRYNPLHPNTQAYFLKLVEDLCKLVGDSPAFGGLSLRVSDWSNAGWYDFPSLNWGYGDWTIRQFEKDTGRKVPGVAGDKSRYRQRYDFLTKNPQNRELWLNWRNARMLNYHRRIRDVLRRYQPTAELYFKGNVDPETFVLERTRSFATSEREGWREIGLDLNQLAKESGIIVIPSNEFGRPKSFSRQNDMQYMAGYLDRDHLAVGRTSRRAFSVINRYFEPGKIVPWKQLGLTKAKTHFHFSSAQASGRNALEKLALVLAEQDTDLLVEGGAQYMFLQDDTVRDWLRAYKQLPRLPFTKHPEVSDPVALWTREAADGFYYFYLVNREGFPIHLRLKFSAAGEIISLVNGHPVTPRNGILSLSIKPFELLAFKGSAETKISAVTVKIPADKLARLQKQLAFCDNLASRLQTGELSKSLRAQEREYFDKQHKIATEAFSQGHFWRARVSLMTPKMVTIFDKTGGFPPEQLHRKFPDLLNLAKTGPSQLPVGIPLNAEQLQTLLTDKTTAVIVTSGTYNKTWEGTPVLKLKTSRTTFKITLPSDGLFRFSFGVIGSEGEMTFSCQGKELGKITLGATPSTCIVPARYYSRGEIQLAISAPVGAGFYGVIVEPTYQALPSTKWVTIGPFPSYLRGRWHEGTEPVKKTLARIDPPQRELNLRASYPGDGKTVSWKFPGSAGEREDEKIDFAIVSGSLAKQVCYAVTQIETKQACRIQLLVSTDWWANAYLNGKPVISLRDPSGAEKDGAQFNTWKFTPAYLDLKKGVNTLLIKNHGGTAMNWVKVVITDTGDLKIHIPTKKTKITYSAK